MKIQLRFSIALALIALALNSFAASPVSTGSFLLVGSMSQFRRVYTVVAGGFNNTDTGPTTELFDPASTVAAPFLLAQPTKLKSGAFQMTFRTTPGLGFTVLSTTDLAARLDDWTSLGRAAEILPGHYQFTDVTPDSAQRFYLVRSP